jgi:hypothetical protein
MSTASSPSASKVTRSRERMRASGLRPVQFWVVDTRLESFVSDVRAQCLALKGDGNEADVLRMTEAAAETVEGWSA